MWIRIALYINLLILFGYVAAFKESLCFAGNLKASYGQWKTCAREKQCQCLETLKKQILAYCSNRKLKQVPTLLPNETIAMDLSNNLIESLGKKNFSSYVHLINLNLAHNKLTTVQKGAFDGLPKLECLSLMNNSIRYNEEGFNNGSFKPLEELRILNIQQYFFPPVPFKNDEHYSFQALNDLQRLETMYLDGIPNQGLGLVFQNLTRLKSLTFNNKTDRCNLTNLLRGFFPRNTALTNVTINSCGVERIQAKVFTPLTILSYLDLSYNEKLTFNSLPNITDGLDKTKFEILKLNHIHEKIGSCVIITVNQSMGFQNLSLKEIYLESNRLTSLEKGVVNNLPVSLKTISVRDNALMFDVYISDLIEFMDKSYVENLIVADQFQTRFSSKHKRSHKGIFKHKTNGTRNIVDEKFIRKNNPAKHNVANITDTLLPGSTEDTAQREFLNDSSSHIKTNHLTTRDASDSGVSNRAKRHSARSQYEHPKLKRKILLHKDMHIDMQIVQPKFTPIPINLRYVDASNMKTRMVLPNCNIRTPNNLKEINLSMNMFYELKGPNQGFENLTKLDLSWNSCTRTDLNIFKSLTSLKYLNLSRNFLDASLNEDSNGTIFEDQHQLNVLDLSKK